MLDVDLEQQINGAKELQQQWRAIGPVPRNLDQRLWREFRQVCDAIFAGREQARAADQQAEQARLQAVEAAIAALEQASQGPDQQISRAGLRDLRAAIDAARAGQRTPADLHIGATWRPLRLTNVRLAEQDYKAAIEQLEQWAAWDAEVSEAEQNRADFESPNPVFAARARGGGGAGRLAATGDRSGAGG